MTTSFARLSVRAGAVPARLLGVVAATAVAVTLNSTGPGSSKVVNPIAIATEPSPTVVAVANVYVTPDGTQNVVTPSASASVAFTVQGIYGLTYNITAVCTGSIFVSGCTPSQTSVTATTWPYNTVNVNFQAGANPTFGKVKLIATLSTNSAEKDSGWVTVLAGNQPWSTVTPDGAYTSANLEPGTPYWMQFQVRNTGTASGTFTIAPNCAGNGITGCTVSQTSVTLNPNAIASVNLNWTFGLPSSSGMAGIRATWNGNSAQTDTGYFNFVTGPPAAITVTPDSATVVSGPENEYEYGPDAGSASFTLQNTGGTTGTFNLAWSCTGYSPCTPSHNSVTLAPGAWAVVGAAVQLASFGQSGTISLRATQNNNPTVTDSGFIILKTWSKQVAVTPDSQFVNRPVGGLDSLQFSLQNVGSLASYYEVTMWCTGNAFVGSYPSNCSASQSSPVYLAPGASTTVWGRFTRGPAGASGQMQMWAQTAYWESQPSANNVGSYNVGIAAAPNTSVTPDGAFSGFLAGSSQTQEFVVWNTGNITDTFVIETRCTGEGFSVGCTTGTTSATLSAGQAHYFDVAYGVGEPGTTGRIVVKATSTIDPTKSDSGWFDLSSPATPAAPSVAITPDGSVRSLPTSSSGQLIFTSTLNTGYQLMALSVSCSGTAFANCTTGLAPGVYWPLYGGQPQGFGPQYTTAATPGTGRMTFTATGYYDGSVVDIGWIDVSTFPAPSLAISVAPDGDQAAGVLPNGQRSTSFLLSNPGSSTATYTLSATCTGAALAPGCSPQPDSVTLAANKDTTIAVNFAAGAGATTGRVTLRAVASSNPMVKDSGWVDVILLPNVPFTIEPPVDSLQVLANSGGQVGFVVRNTSTQAITVEGRLVCAGQVFASTCSYNTSQSTLTPGNSVTIASGFTSGSSGRTGNAKLRMWIVGNAAVTDSGRIHFTSTTSSFVAPDVQPSSNVRFVYPGATSTANFSLQNKGTASGTFTVSATCTGPVFASGCTVSPTSAAVGGGAMTPVTINFTAGGGGTAGSIRLVATQSGYPTVTDTAWMTVSTGNVGTTTVSVSPDQGAALSQINYSAIQQFFVYNTGNAPGTFALNALCTGLAAGASCTTNPTSVALPVGGAAAVNLTMATSSLNGSTGRMRLLATLNTDPTVKDSGWVNVTLGNAVAVTPDGGSTTAFVSIKKTVPFTVLNGRTARTSFTFGANCSGAAFVAGSCRVVGGNFSLDPGRSTTVGVEFDPGPVGATGNIAVSAWGNTPGQGAVFDTGSVSVTVLAAPAAGVLVSPHLASVNNLEPNRDGTVAKFTVTNTGTQLGKYSLDKTCTWGVGSLTCSLSESTIELAPAESTLVSIAYRSGAMSTSGSLVLRATLIEGGTGADSGRINAATWTSDPSTTISIKIDSLNPGTSIAREQCLTIAAGEDAAYECGDLRLVHALPATTTMGKTRAPTLIYNSRHARGLALVAATVTIPTSITPASLEATFTVGTATRTRTYSAWSGGTRRIVFPVDATDLALLTGRYAYTLQVRGIGGSGTTTPVSDTGTVVLVNRNFSHFGEGWWLDGLEQLLYLSPTQFLWIGGDGSTRLYNRTGTGVWTVPAVVDRSEVLDSIPDIDPNTAGDQRGFRRRLRNGAYVEFDATFRHVATVNRQQHRTVFGWGTQSGSSILNKITLFAPSSKPNAMEVDYTFTYVDVSGLPMLTTVHAPSAAGGSAQRNITVTRVARRVKTISDPGSPAWLPIDFIYDASNRIAGRKDRLGRQTTFGLDSVGTLNSASIDMTATPPSGYSAITTTFCAAESRSVNACAPGPQPIDSFVTWVNGPRTDVTDVTRFHPNRFGAPQVIVSSVSDTTIITRQDGTYPALVTQLRQPNGFVTAASYNARGLPTLTEAVSPYGAGSAYTVYKWNADWDMVDTIFAPGATRTPMASAEKTVFHYDKARGNRDWQEDGRGFLSRVSFAYDTYNRLMWIDPPGNQTDPAGDGLEHIQYDTLLGNVEQVTSPGGSVTKYVRDALGRDSVTISPIDAAKTTTLVDKFTYDLQGRLTDQRTYAPQLSFTFQDFALPGGSVAMMRHVVTTFDPNGNVTSVERKSENHQGGPLQFYTDVTTSMTYDAAGRKLTEINPNRIRTWQYDPAGNATHEIQALGTVTMTYDALNRLLTRSVPGRKQPLSVINNLYLQNVPPSNWVQYPYFRRKYAGTSNYQDSLVIFDDVATFTYDKNGNIKTATNNDAQIGREYYPNGQLKTDSTRIARYTYEAAPAAPVFAGNWYRQTYTYDLSGRRLSRNDNNPACSNCTQSYHYDAQSGFLDWSQDHGQVVGPSIRFNFAYDEAGRLSKRWTNGASGSVERVSVGHGYDADGQLTSRITKAGTSAQTTVYSDVHTYDARGKIAYTTSASDVSSIPFDRWETRYDGFGALIGTGRTRGGGSIVDLNTMDALGNVTARFSNVGLSQNSKQVNFVLSGDRISTATRPAHRWVDEGGPLDKTAFQTFYWHDTNGNQTEENTVQSRAVNEPVSGLPTFVQDSAGHSFTWMMYGVDNKLRYAQKTWYEPNMARRTIFTEYRYDALGRRVLMRAQRDTAQCIPATEYKCQSTMDRFVWDGDQVVAEFRGPGTHGLSDTLLNAAGGAAPWNGFVRYMHAGGIDEPLIVWGAGSNMDGVIPHLSWRGRYEAGSNVLDGTLLDGGNPPNMWIWPSRYTDVNLAPEARDPIPEPTRWLGSLIENQVDLNGLAYRRNRYYNPSTGRFTQEDPIGLAGGLNMYGFADGDPVNLSDPFGLCPPRDNNPCPGGSASASQAIFASLAAMPIAEAILGSGKLGLTFASPGAGAGRASLSALRIGGARVIGSYPGYIFEAAKAGAKSFSMPTKAFEAMTEAQQWAATTRFLDRGIHVGAEFQLGSSAANIRKGSWLSREVQYLLDKGYKWGGEFTKLVPK